MANLCSIKCCPFFAAVATGSFEDGFSLADVSATLLLSDGGGGSSAEDELLVVAAATTYYQWIAVVDAALDLDVPYY